MAMSAFRLKADVVAVDAEIKGKGLLFQGGNFYNNFGENKVRITDAVVVIVELAGECVLIVFAEEVELFGKAVTVRRVAAAEMNKDDFFVSLIPQSLTNRGEELFVIMAVAQFFGNVAFVAVIDKVDHLGIMSENAGHIVMVTA